MRTCILILIAAFQCVYIVGSGQTYISQKQSYYIDGKEVFFQGEKKIILGDTLIVEIPNYPTLFGTIKFDESSLKRGYKTFRINNGGVLLIFKDQIIVNLFNTKYNIAISYFLQINENGVLVTLQESKDAINLESKKLQEAIHNEFVKLYGDLTANCIKDNKVRIGMKESALKFVLLDESPKSINVIETAKGISKQYVYKNMYIYTENGIVTAIQREE